MILFTFCAVFIVDTVPASAAIGPSTITWWLVLAIFFFLPYGLISAELGATYPEQGGLYVWVKRAYGERWAARTTWYYWVNVALWMPSVYIAFAGMFATMFFPGMSLFAQIAIGIALTWITVWVNIQSLSLSKYVPNIGAVAKVVVVLAMAIAGVRYFMSGNPFANEISWETLKPTMGTGLAFLPAIVYNLCGFELMSGAAGEMKNPSRDIPKAVVVSGVLITVFYLLTTITILGVVPVDSVNLINGILDTFYAVFGNSGIGGVITIILGSCILFTFFANMVTWTLGANRAAVEAAESGELPGVFGSLVTKNQAPKGAAIITGIVSTVVFIIYGFMAESAESLFWTLFAFSGILFLFPYAIIFPAFIKLRAKDKDIYRPYKVPGPKWFTTAIAILAELFIAQGIILFAWVPGEPVQMPIIVGTLVVVLIGEYLIQISLKKQKPPVAPVTDDAMKADTKRAS